MMTVAQIIKLQDDLTKVAYDALLKMGDDVYLMSGFAMHVEAWQKSEAEKKAA